MLDVPPLEESNPVLWYATEITEERLPACRLQRMACERHLRDLERQDSADFPYVFDEAMASHWIGFFPGILVHSKGEWAGRPLDLIHWQKFCIGSIHGWRRSRGKLKGRRRFRKVFIQIPRKGGKSTVAAGVGLGEAFFKGEPGAEVYSAATKLKQAKIVWEEAANMIEANPGLAPLFTIHRSRGAECISFRETKSKYEPVSAEGKKLDGFNPQAFIMDELHEVKDPSVLTKLRFGMGARREPLEFIITTAGEADSPSVWLDIQNFCTAVLEGNVEDETQFVFMTGIDKEDDWSDPSVWRKANPSLGVSCKIEAFESMAAEAKILTSTRLEFQRYWLNMPSTKSNRWLSREDWDACADIDAEFLESLKGTECVIGVDLSNRRDVSAVVQIFQHDDHSISIIPHFWLPEKRLIDDPTNGPFYRSWAESGHLNLTQGTAIDHEFIAKRVNELAEEYEIMEIAYDPYSAVQFSLKLQSEGLNLVKVRQGYLSLSEACKSFEAALVTGKVHHDGNPMMGWMVSNTTVSMDPAGNIKPNKDKSKNKIDGVAALVTGVARLVLAPMEEESVYETEGMTWI